jgi:hypothetical protein
MGKNKPYNGHKNWNHWNVSLWIHNDEGLYWLARRCICITKTRHAAAVEMMDDLNGRGEPNREPAKTPDGAPYSVTTIRAAMRGM